jgi:hypothetical protein
LVVWNSEIEVDQLELITDCTIYRINDFLDVIGIKEKVNNIINYVKNETNEICHIKSLTFTVNNDIFRSCAKVELNRETLYEYLNN